MTSIQTSSSGTTHSFSDEEKYTFTNMINEIVKGDEDLKEMIPIDAESDDLWHACSNGILLCKLINAIVPGSMDMRAVNIKKIDIYRVKENLKLAIGAA